MTNRDKRIQEDIKMKLIIGAIIAVIGTIITIFKS
jgi:hypothetical protein